MIRARELTKGQWMIRPSGAYLIDGVQVIGQCAYVGTCHGVFRVGADIPVLVAF